MDNGGEVRLKNLYNRATGHMDSSKLLNVKPGILIVNGYYAQEITSSSGLSLYLTVSSEEGFRRKIARAWKGKRPNLRSIGVIYYSWHLLEYPHHLAYFACQGRNADIIIDTTFLERFVIITSQEMMAELQESPTSLSVARV